MNTMKRSMIGLCAAFACVGVANANTAWDYVDTFPDRGTWAMMDNGKSLPKGASGDDVWVSVPTEDKTAKQGHWISAAGVVDTTGVDGIPFLDVVTAADALGISLDEGVVFPATAGDPFSEEYDPADKDRWINWADEYGADIANSAVSTVSHHTTGMLAVRDAVTQEQWDEANEKFNLGAHDAVTQEQWNDADKIANGGTIASITQTAVNDAQTKLNIGIRTGVSQAEIDTNTFIVEQINEVIDTGFIEADALAADGDTTGVSRQTDINVEIATIEADDGTDLSIVRTANTEIAIIIADIITADEENVSDALKALSIAVDIATTAQDITSNDVDRTAGNGTAGGNFTDALALTTGITLTNGISVTDTASAELYIKTNPSEAANILLAQDVINTEAIFNTATGLNSDALDVKIEAQAAVANAVIASLDMSSDESLANRDAAQKILDTGPLSEITSGDVFSAWETTVLGVRTEITQQQFDDAQVIVNDGLTVSNASFSLPGMTPVSRELYEYAKAVVNAKESSLKDGYNQGDITTAQAVVDAGVLSKITTSQHFAAQTIVKNNDVDVAESLLDEGLTDGVSQGDLDVAQKVVDAQKVLTDVEAAGGDTATSRDAVTQTEVDENVELLSLLTYAKEKFGKNIGAIDFSDDQIDLETMQAIVKLAEAQVLVNAGVLEEEVTAAQIEEAQAIVDGGVKEEVTAEQIAIAKAIVDGGVLEAITQEQVDAQIEEIERTAKVLNNGVSAENLTAEQIEEQAAKKAKYIDVYGEETFNEVVAIYGVDDLDGLKAALGVDNADDETEIEVFDAAGGVDMVKAMVNTGNLETALRVMSKLGDDTMTMKDFITKSNPDVSGSAAGSTAGVSVVGGAIGGHQQSSVASSGKYGLKKHSLSVTKQLGISSGGGGRDTGAWMEVFGSASEMDMRDSVPGYNADSSGIVVGVDKTIGDMMIGAAISVADIDVDGKSSADSKTDSKQYQGTLYGTLMMDSYYINGSVAYAHASNDTSRIGHSGGLTGSYGTDIYAASLGIGIPVDLGNSAIIPQATLSYASISPDAYTESGVGALHVDIEDMTSFGIKAGVAVINTIVIDGGIIAPKLRLMADWDISREKAVVNSSWVGDVDNTIYSTTGARPASLGAVMGAGVDYASDDGLYVLSLDYDLSTRSNFVSHAGSAKLRVNF